MRAVLHELALPTFERYAARWGWQVQAHDLTADGSGADAAAQRAKWTKTCLLRDALSSHPMALWLDADILLLRDDDDIRQHMRADHFQALALEQVPAEHRVNPNTGVWLLRSCPAAFAFLDAVEAAGPQPGPWADQGAVLAALGWDRGDERYHWAGPGAGSRHLTGPVGCHRVGTSRPSKVAAKPRPSTAAQPPTATAPRCRGPMPCTSWACPRRLVTEPCTPSPPLSWWPRSEPVQVRSTVQVSPLA
jgi:hypothetical protein